MKKISIQDIFQLLFLLLCIISLVSGLSLIIRGAELSAFLPTAITSVVCTWFMSRNKAASIFGLLWMIFGLLLLWVIITGSILPILKLLYIIGENQLVQFVKLHGYQVKLITGTHLLIRESVQAIAIQTAAMFMRIRVWTAGFNSGLSGSDPVVRIFAWCVILWLVSGWAGWWVGKNKVLIGIFPALIILSLSSKYSNSDLFPLWLMCLGTICLYSLNNFVIKLQSWFIYHVDFAELTISNTLIAVTILTVLISLSGWVLPFVSFKDMLEQYRRRNGQENQAAKSLGLVYARETARPIPAVLDPIRSPGLPNVHLLTSGPELSKKIVFTVHTGEKSARIPDTPGEINTLANLAKPHHYWGGYRYDIYTGTGWVSSPVINRMESAETALMDIPPGYKILSQDFVVNNGGKGVLYWSGMIYRSNFPFEAAWRSIPGNKSTRADDSFLGDDVFGAVNDRSNYRVESLVRSVTEDELRAAGRIFPDSIQQKFTKLPSTVPERVYSLARKLTSSEATPYDEVKGLEKYLRDNYPYTLNASLPPIGKDVVDYFLFDLKKGYCDYYASAMVVMARSIGLPARLVSGFASGSFDNSTGTFTVRASDAHAWVEIYFSGIGWVEFEPTANQPEIIRSNQLPDGVLSENIPGRNWENFVQSFYRVSDPGRPFFLFLIGILCVILLAMIVETVFFVIASPKNILKYMVRSIFQQTKKTISDLNAGQTALEFAIVLQTQYPEIYTQMTIISELYNRVFFSRLEVQKLDLPKAIRAFRLMRWKLVWLITKERSRHRLIDFGFRKSGRQ